MSSALWRARGPCAWPLAILVAAAITVLTTEREGHCAEATLPRLPQARPEAVGMNSARLAAIDQLVAEGLGKHAMPGCVVLVARQGKIVWLKAYGDRQVQPERAAMTVDTCFDLASLTKPVATATSVMILWDQHKLRLEETVARYIPQFAENGKESITVEQLLTHQGGLIADNALADYAGGAEEAWRRIFALRPRNRPGKSFTYSDVGFLVLGELVHRVSGKTLDAFARERIFEPLGMKETRFLPTEPMRGRAAPTERRDGHWMQGEVHDPRAFALGGVAGHAGVFSTAEDLAVYAQMLLGSGQYHGVRILSHQAVANMTTPRSTAAGLRGLGWDMRSSFSGNRSPEYSQRAFGHGGFTGTGLWIDPARRLTVIFLSNRLHPDGKGSVNPLIARIGTAAVESLQDEAPAR